MLIKLHKNYFITTLALVALAVILSTNVAFAAPYYELAPISGTGQDTYQKYVRDPQTGTWKWQTCLPLSPSDTDCIKTVRVTFTQSGLGTYINGLYKIAVAAASVLAVLMLIIGGFNYVSTDAIGNKEEGKEVIKSALGGLILILASWVILYTLNPQLVSLNIVSQPLNRTDLKGLMDLANNAKRDYAILQGLLSGANAADADANLAHSNALDLRANADNLQNIVDSGLMMEQSEAIARIEAVTGNSYGTDYSAAIADANREIASLKLKADEMDNNARVLYATNTGVRQIAQTVADNNATYHSGNLYQALFFDYASAINNANKAKDAYNFAIQRLGTISSFPSNVQTDLKNRANSAIDTICQEITRQGGAQASSKYATCIANKIP